MELKKHIQELKTQLKPRDIEFFLGAAYQVNEAKRSRKKILAALESLHQHPYFSKFVLNFYLIDQSKKFRCVAIAGLSNNVARKYLNMRLYTKKMNTRGYLISEDFTKESKARQRYIKEVGITRSLYFPVNDFGILSINVLNGTRSLDPYQSRFIKLFLQIVVAAAVGLAIDNEKNFNAAIRDPMTGIYNKGYFSLQLQKESYNIRRGGSVSLIMIDIDWFKKFNDTYGHVAGDKLLKQIVNVFGEGVRKFDTVARYGGEEFSLILPGATIKAAVERAENIRKAVENYKFDISEMDKDYRITISLGVSNIPYNASDEKELLQYADKALYISKREGRNKTSVYEESHKGSNILK